MLLLLGLVTGYLNVECVSRPTTLFRNYSLNVLNGVLLVKVIRLPIYLIIMMKTYLFSAMCKWSNHSLHHLLPSERVTGHDLRPR